MSDLLALDARGELGRIYSVSLPCRFSETRGLCEEQETKTSECLLGLHPDLMQEHSKPNLADFFIFFHLLKYSFKTQLQQIK